MLRFEGLEGEYAAAGEERGSELERGVLGGGANENDGTVFDSGEEGVLLGLGKPVDLVNKENSAAALRSGAAGAIDSLTELSHARGNGEESDEGVERSGESGGEGASDGGLPRSGRTPEDNGRDAGGPKHGGRTEEVVLAKHGVKSGRAHTIRQRGGGGRVVALGRQRRRGRNRR